MAKKINARECFGDGRIDVRDHVKNPPGQEATP